MHNSKDPKMLRTPSEMKAAKARKILGEINSGPSGQLMKKKKSDSPIYTTSPSKKNKMVNLQNMNMLTSGLKVRLGYDINE